LDCSFAFVSIRGLVREKLNTQNMACAASDLDLTCTASLIVVLVWLSHLLLYFAVRIFFPSSSVCMLRPLLLISIGQRTVSLLLSSVWGAACLAVCADLLIGDGQLSSLVAQVNAAATFYTLMSRETNHCNTIIHFDSLSSHPEPRSINREQSNQPLSQNHSVRYPHAHIQKTSWDVFSFYLFVKAI
jgi:hypothetical protein